MTPKGRKKTLSISRIIHEVEGCTDKFEAVVARLRHLMGQLDRYRARAAKRRRARAAKRRRSAR